MGRRVVAQSNDPAAAALEVLEQINYVGGGPESEPTAVVFNGEIDGGTYRNLTVDVAPGTPPEEVVRALRHAAHQPR
ncbi:hypothetical protein ACIBI3_25850 [Actinomadura luteofluorescens]|uniref:hypothetical protein n=1 Tax=Actinomadura luteofluorescens TaxID=46163 RepID=UPI003495CDD9